MPRNSLLDLNNLLFEQLENLITAETKEEIELETRKSKAVKDVAGAIIENANVQLEAAKLQLEYGRNDTIIPKMLLEVKDE